MSPYYLDEIVSIEEYPLLDRAHLAKKGSALTIGDLHANALKLLYVLVRHGWLQISQANYHAFIMIYYEAYLQKGNMRSDHAKKRIEALLQRFDQLLEETVVLESARGSLFRLLGDDLCDRGACDYFVLKWLHKIYQEGIALEILLSNHNVEFLTCYEKKRSFHHHGLAATQGHSADTLEWWIEQEVITLKEISDLVENFYKKCLKSVAYSLEPGREIALYSHAGIGLNTIRDLACFLRIPYEGNYREALVNTLDAINTRVTRDYLKKNKGHVLFPVDRALQEGPFQIDSRRYPFVYLVWNRSYHSLDRPQDILFVHGHDPGEENAPNVYNLDNRLGKSQDLFHAQYTALYTPPPPREKSSS